MNDAERIQLLRARCLDRKAKTIPWDGDSRLIARSLRASQGIFSWTVRRGLLTRDLLAWAPLEMDPEELLAGRLAQDCPAWAQERQEARAYLKDNEPQVYTPGQTGHCQLDFTRLFELGIDGLREEIQRLERVSAGKKAEVYQSFAAALEGLSLFIENTAHAAEQAAGRASAERQGELDLAASACRRVAHLPPATFFEALQLSWLAILGCQLADRAFLINPGHLDRTLGPYYQADIQAGRITPERGLALIESLYLLLNENIPDGLAISIMVGGRDAQGDDLTNPLSYLCLEALRRTRLVYPTVGVCWHAGTPEDLTALAVDLIAQGLPNPAFFGDETIQRGLQSYGVPVLESWNYVNSTCVEITPVGSSNIWVASPYFSTCQILLDEIGAQAQSGSPAASFDAFLAAYRARLAKEIGAAVEVENNSRRIRQQAGGKPLQSVFTQDCISRGQDIDDGGARYNWVECSFVGLANLADSLHVVREEVYEQKRLSLGGLEHILASNFEEQEAVRQRFLNAYPKYGNDCEEVDALVGKIVAFAREECARYAMHPDDSPFVPGAFCWVMHERLGSACGATPDGRRAGFPFADGCGAAQGREKAGPTAAVLSVTSWDAAPLIGGAAFNMKFTASLFRAPGTARRLQDLIVTFLERGGFETQVNVIDTLKLKAAQQNPEHYRDLVVRIGGYTDYFTRLTPEMQAEVILRTEYGEI
jgi:trans-4-hydroxy-L-proline dehydratase